MSMRITLILYLLLLALVALNAVYVLGWPAWVAAVPIVAAVTADLPEHGPRPCPAPGIRDSSPGGVLDLAANVSEWTRSIAVDRGSYAMWVQGGSWLLPGRETTYGSFARLVPLNHRSPDIGFRVVYDRGGLRLAPARHARDRGWAGRIGPMYRAQSCGTIPNARVQRDGGRAPRSVDDPGSEPGDERSTCASAHSATSTRGEPWPCE